MRKFDIAGHEPSLLPDGEWKLAWSDEFDGDELDRTKWDYRLNFWGERFEAYSDRGVVLDGNSHVELHRVEENGRYVSPQLQTGCNSFDVPREPSKNPWGHKEFWPLGELPDPKFMHRYGYYECRCKFQREPQVMWSAFWVQSPSIGTRKEPEWCGIESDIMEFFKHGHSECGNIMGGYGKQFKEEGRIKYEFEETEDGWHYFGMDWQPDGYVFYYDGKEISRCTEHVSHVPEFILLTTEVQGYRWREPQKYEIDGKEIVGYPYKIDGEATDDAFIVDFVRVFDKIG